VTSIIGSAFNYCTSLTNIEVDEENTAYCSVDGVLFNKDQTSLTRYPEGKTAKSYTIPNSVKTIEYKAFYDCSNLTSVTIPDSVTIIGEDSFYGCTGLTSLTIPDSVTTIGNWAFDNCTGLTGVTIGSGVTYIGYKAFYGCSNLKSVAFRNTSGWKCYTNSEYTNVYQSFSSSDLSNASNSAIFLTSISYYSDYWWKRG
jgi:hypothetical protein